MRVFITGGAGFIGSHLCDALVARGDSVTIVDNLSTGSRTNVAHLEAKIETIIGDIRDVAVIEKAVAGADVVLHMAAALGVSTILESPIESISTNFTGSEVVLMAAAKFNKRIIIASTSEIYGKNPKQPLSETDDRIIGTPQKLRWTYSDAKALEEDSTINEKEFRYNGAKPKTKEQVILMICDTSEAISRVSGLSEEEIKKMVIASVHDKLLDGQFDQSDITINDLKRIEDVITLSISGTSHYRTKYKEIPNKN